MYSDQHLPWLVVEYKGKNPNQQKKNKKPKRFIIGSFLSAKIKDISSEASFFCMTSLHCL